MTPKALTILTAHLIFLDPKAMFEQMGLGGPGGLPVPSFLTAPDVRSRSHVLSSSIFDLWNTLHVMIEHHEETIRKRWLKRTREQRKKILYAAWPGMDTLHRPDIDAFKRKNNSQEAYKWPYINTDDLSRPKLFLLFLNARARNQPFAFARADIDACRFGITSRALLPGFLNEHVMMFTGRISSNTYGELIAWEITPMLSIGSPRNAALIPGRDFLFSKFKTVFTDSLSTAAKISCMK